MRIFEVLLILASFVALVLSFKNQPAAVRRWTAGITVSILLLHSALEGFRYQMIFAYIFVIVFTIFAIAGTHKNQSKTKTRKALKILTTGLAFVLLGATSFLAYALPVFKLPKPTGSYDIGIQYLHLVDEKRNDPFLDTSAKKRELMVKVYYPSKADNTKPFSPYFPSPQLVRLFADFYGMPGFAFDQLNLVKTNSKEGLDLSDKEPTYPVILFSHGAGTTMEVQTSQSEDLASHGYIVVAIDHTYVSAGTVFPDSVVSHKDATTDFKVPEPAEVITQIMADDASFVIGQLEEMNSGKTDSIFAGRLDLDEIGIIGYSVGGAAAYNLAINDPRIKAAIDLDGVVYITPHGNAENVAPFLMLANDRYHIQAITSETPLMKTFEEMDDVDQKITIDMYGSRQAYQNAYNKAQQNVTGLTEVLKSSGSIFTIEGSDHMKFTDIGLFIGSRWLREKLNIGGKTDPGRCIEITEAVTRAFFDQHLKNDTRDALGSLIDKFPELQKIDLQ
jgi:predicted dienelactone hydrolase